MSSFLRNSKKRNRMSTVFCRPVPKIPEQTPLNSSELPNSCLRVLRDRVASFFQNYFSSTQTPKSGAYSKTFDIKTIPPSNRCPYPPKNLPPVSQ